MKSAPNLEKREVSINTSCCQKKNYWRDEVLDCILFNIIVLPNLETVRDICWLANLPEISNTVRTTMKTKMATSPTILAVSHPGFLKF